VIGTDFLETPIILGYIKRKKSLLDWQKLASQEWLCSTSWSLKKRIYKKGGIKFLKTHFRSETKRITNLIGVRIGCRTQEFYEPHEIILSFYVN
jgi:hypothetical protein